MTVIPSDVQQSRYICHVEDDVLIIIIDRVHQHQYPRSLYSLFHYPTQKLLITKIPPIDDVLMSARVWHGTSIIVIISLVFSTITMSISQEIDKELAYAISLRREFHQHPEV